MLDAVKPAASRMQMRFLFDFRWMTGGCQGSVRSVTTQATAGIRHKRIWIALSADCDKRFV